VKKLTDVTEYLEKTAGGIPWLMALGTPIWEAIKTHPGKTLAGVGGLAAAGAALHATGLAGGLEGRDAGETMSYRINRGLNALSDRIRADETAAEAFTKTLGGGVADRMLGLTDDIISKTKETLQDKLQVSPMRQLIFQTLKSEDPILADADNKTLLEAYHTMAKVAPTLATDKNAVRSFLTLAATSGGGLDFQTIKGIADAENAVIRAKGGM